MNKAIFAIFAAALVTGCTPPDPSATRAISSQIPVDEDFYFDGVKWTNAPDSYAFALQVRANQGQYEVCGAGAYLVAQFRGTTREILEDMKVSANGTLLVADLTFFSTVAREDQLSTATANCVLSGVQIQPGPQSYEIGRVGSKRSYRND